MLSEKKGAWIRYLSGISGVEIEESVVIDVQIDVAQLQLLQTCGERSGYVADVGDDFRRDVELLARDLGLLDGRAELGLGLVDFSAIPRSGRSRDQQMFTGRRRW